MVAAEIKWILLRLLLLLSNIYLHLSLVPKSEKQRLKKKKKQIIEAQKLLVFHTLARLQRHTCTILATLSHAYFVFVFQNVVVLVYEKFSLFEI